MQCEAITVQVSPGLVKLFREADPEQRLKLSLIMEVGLQSALRDTRSLQEVMSDISRKAQARGLTEEILADILSEPDRSELPEWCNIYEGLTDEEVDDIESMIIRGPVTTTGVPRDLG